MPGLKSKIEFGVDTSNNALGFWLLELLKAGNFWLCGSKSSVNVMSCWDEHEASCTWIWIRLILDSH
jgi:hypothetical protein